MEDFHALEQQAARQWYFTDGRIVIPRHHLSGALVQALSSNPPVKPVRDAGVLRNLIQISDFVTTQTKATRVWLRYVRPSKNGVPLSNQRSERRNEVLEKFDATGTLSFDTDDVKADDVKGLMTYCGKYVGCGASRKMGHGRFTVTSFAPALEETVIK